MQETYNPQVNTGLPPLKIGGANPLFQLYSEKKIVSSSNSVRNKRNETKIRAEELEDKLMNFENDSTNDVVYKHLRTS